MRVWFITGAGRGLGREFARAALAAGDRVIATARRPEVLDDLSAEYDGQLVVLPLDVTDRAAVMATVTRAVGEFGRLDVVVNNAGYGLLGAIEEITEDEARAQMDTNFFGALWVSQAVIPYLRAQESGHIVQISTVGAIGTMPTGGLYSASKWALEAFSEALAQEVAGFGVKVTLAELGGFATDWAGSSLRMATPMTEYDDVRADLASGAFVTKALAAAEVTDEEMASLGNSDPADAAQALLDLVNVADPPVRQLVGADAYTLARVSLTVRRDDYRRDPRFNWPG